MSTASIPAWNSQGGLPPVIPDALPSSKRSPYRASLVDLMSRFGRTPERKRILEGFLNYRNALHSIGLDSGFQWINGSFLEHIERIENRAPRDIDVVTFFHLPDGQSQETLSQANSHLFNWV